MTPHYTCVKSKLLASLPAWPRALSSVTLYPPTLETLLQHTEFLPFTQFYFMLPAFAPAVLSSWNSFPLLSANTSPLLETQVKGYLPREVLPEPAGKSLIPLSKGSCAWLCCPYHTVLKASFYMFAHSTLRIDIYLYTLMFKPRG